MSDIYFQIFKKKPDIEFIIKLIQLYGFKELDDNYKFTIQELEKRYIIKEINKIQNELKNYYINCKYHKYVENLTEKKSITILRHFLRVINYKIISKEKYSDNKKYLIYNIKNNNLPNIDSKLTINFD